MNLDDEQRAALNVARDLAHHGVPIFLASPATGPDGTWDPTGGTGGTGYWLPKGWELTTADPTVVDRWRPGWALGAVGGHALDVVDVDPRNGGDQSVEQLRAAGLWPVPIGEAATPSGGVHHFTNRLRVRSRDGVLPGVDVKAGHAEGRLKPDGTTPDDGRGFVFIAPTRRRSKATGLVESYHWAVPPAWDELDPADPSVEGLRDLVEQVRARSATSTPVDVPHAAWDALGPSQRARVERWLRAAVEGERVRLADVATWPEGRTDEHGRGWEKFVSDVAHRFGALARADWTPWTLEDGSRAFLDVVPPAMLAAVPGKWEQQSHRGVPAPWPAALDTPPAPTSSATSAAADQQDDEPPPVEEEQRDGSSMSSSTSEPLPRLWAATALAAPAPTAWLARYRLPRSAVTILVGDEGIGKSLLWVLLVGAITTGRALPGFGLPAREPATVVLVLTEDEWSSVVRPRLEVVGADLTKVQVICTEQDGSGSPVFPRDLHLVRDSGAALVIVDAFLDTVHAGLTMKDPQQARQALHPWKEVATVTGAAIVLLTHTNRVDSKNPRDRYGITGELRKKARMTLYAQRDEDGHLVVGPEKSNLVGQVPASVFAITPVQFFPPSDENDGTVPRLDYLGESTMTARQHLEHDWDEQHGDDRSESGDAAEWLTALLEHHGGSLPRADVVKAARAEGISEKVLRRAREKSGVLVERKGFNTRGAPGSVWSLPFVPTFMPAHAHDSERAGTGTNVGTNEDGPVDDTPDGPSSWPPCSACGAPVHPLVGGTRCLRCKLEEGAA